MTRKQLRQIINEELRLLNEIDLVGSNELLVEEFVELDAEIKRVEAWLKEKKQRRNELSGIFDNMLMGITDVKQRYIKTKKYVLKVAAMGSTRATYNYKDMFELALSKVNRRTRALLERVKDESANFHQLSTRYKYTTNEGIIAEIGIFKKLIDYGKRIWVKLKSLFYGVKNDLNDLESISKKMLK